MDIKKKILKLFPVDYYLSTASYSQEGEDMVLKSFFENRKSYKGFFVDVGAHHPVRFSNTCHFYKKGWRGINIEPTPDAIKPFKLLRKRDINLNVGVSGSREKLTFYCFNEPALNGFSKELSEQRDGSEKYKVIKEVPVQTFPLRDILATYLPAGRKIDFLTIDVEGLDLEVLRSNDWERFSPDYVLVEDKIETDNLPASEVYKYLTEKGYRLVAKTFRTLFFQLRAAAPAS